MKKCDVIIPVYNAADWVKLCVYAVIKNTKKEFLNKIYLLDDNSNDYTVNCLNNLKEKYSDLIIVSRNEKNLGFVKNCNKGIKLSMDDSKSDCLLLLNSDCLLANNSIEKLMNHINNDNNIGLICPVASNAANVSLPIFEGFSYMQMDNLLENKFKGKSFDACTVVGNCLMITKKCVETIGYLDEIYGMGYGEETDYHFRAKANGFKAKIAIDTYVFHKAEASFGNSKAKTERINHNRKVFFERWGKEYNRDYSQYCKNDPIKYIMKNLTDSDKKADVDTLFYLPDVHQNAGGCHVIVDLINYMNINGYSSNLLCNNIVEYKEIMLFNPISIKNVGNVETKKIVSTIWASNYLAYKIAEAKKVPLINFVQGYEPYFENANIYGLVELSYKLSDSILTISNYLKDKLKNIFEKDSKVITNSIQYDLLHHINTNDSVKTITIILRGSDMKGDFILMDLLKLINKYQKNLNVNVIYMNKYIEFPNLDNNSINYNLINGPIERYKIHELLQNSDVYIDASINEGFGLIALEAMTAGCVPITSNSFGIHEYMKDNKNGFIINEINDVSKYYEKLELLIKDKKLFKKLKNECLKTSKDFDYDNRINEYIKYFSSINDNDIKNKVFSKEEEKLINAYTVSDKSSSKVKKFVYKFDKIIPRRIKERLKKIITSLYNTYQH